MPGLHRFLQHLAMRTRVRASSHSFKINRCAAGLPAAADRLSTSLRHSTITAALNAGVPIRDVQDFAGHADPRTTRRYDRSRRTLDRHATYASPPGWAATGTTTTVSRDRRMSPCAGPQPSVTGD